MVVIEFDGSIHDTDEQKPYNRIRVNQKALDESRDKLLKAVGFTVIRFDMYHLKYCKSYVKRTILDALHGKYNDRIDIIQPINA